MIFLLCQVVAAARSDSVVGRVRDEDTGVGLAGVRVVLVGTLAEANTGPGGRYALARLSARLGQLRFTLLGYQPLEVQIASAPGQVLLVDVDLRPLAQTLPPIEVTGRPVPLGAPPSREAPVEPASDIGRSAWTRETLTTDPLRARDDPFASVAAVAAATMQPDFPSTLQVRGGAADQNLVLVDGVPVRAGMHLGGIASAFNPDAIAGLAIYSAAMPARFGGRLSSTLEISPVRGYDRGLHVRAALDPTSIRQMAQGPLPRGLGTFLISGRTSYRGVFSQDQTARPNRYDDLLIRLAVGGPRSEVSWLHIGSRDRVAFPSAAAQSTGAPGPSSLPPNSFAWSAQTDGLVWRHRPGGTLPVAARVWRTATSARIVWPLGPSPGGVASDEVDLGAGVDARVGAAGSTHFGVEAIRYQTKFASLSSVAGVLGAVPVEASPWVAAGFVETGFALPGGIGVTAGLRVNRTQRFGLDLEPRLSARVRLMPRLALLASATRIHQYVQSYRNEETPIGLAFGGDLGVAVGAEGLRPARADQLAAAVRWDAGSATAVTVDVYRRNLSHLAAVPVVADGPFPDRHVPEGTSRVMGGSIAAARHGRTYDLGATFHFTSVQIATLTGRYAPSRRGLYATVGLRSGLGERGWFRLLANASSGSRTSVFGGGLDWLAPGLLSEGVEIAGSPGKPSGPLNARPLPLYTRMDLEIGRQVAFRAAGRASVLTASLGVINILDRRNTLGFITDGTRESRVTFPGRSLRLQLAWQF